MRKLIPFTVMILVVALSAFLIIRQAEKPGASQLVVLDSVYHKASSVDHSQFDVLNKTFETGPDVTEACLSCHNGRGKELLQTAHWNWSRDEFIPGKGITSLGKRNILNNFCIGTRGSEATCTRCHIGYGFKDQHFDFANEKNIDCLVCHDNTNSYQKEKGGAGFPKESVNLGFVARNVGLPTKENCGVCHFWGGGGNNVKHGDLDIAMLDCSKEIDVHMASDGLDMSCIDCHTAENHQMKGKLYAISSENKDRATCEQCHGNTPHNNQIINEHDLRIACQTCHIPYYAKANSTKMIWDWSTAGEVDEKGNPKHWNDQDGNHKYLGIKGTFIWDDHVEPEYTWFNGTAKHQLIEDKIDTAALPLKLNTLIGAYCIEKDSTQMKCSKIWPVKVHRGKQIYDSKNLTLIQPKLYAKEKGEGAYWKDFDWDKASEIGMENINMNYSGQYDFVETEMTWPLNHQVAPKNEALSCKSCHKREEGRLAALTDFYLPGRDRMAILDNIGIILILLSIVGVIIHSILRIIYRKNCFLKSIDEA
jgi:octaheme c-type cytochrome (tetrathionate reductase family)